MKTVAIEDLYIGTILTLCENAAELGCPRDKDVDMWFRELPYEEQVEIAEKMIKIEERYHNVSNENKIKTDNTVKVETIEELAIKLPEGFAEVGEKLHTTL